MSDLLSLPLPTDSADNSGTPFRTRPRYVRAWRWMPEFAEGKLQWERGSVRMLEVPTDPLSADRGEWLHPSGVITPDNGNPSYVYTRAGREFPANGDVIVLHEDDTRSVYKPAAFIQEFEPI